MSVVVSLPGKPCMPSPYSFGVRAFDCGINVSTDCPEAFAILERYTFPWLPRTFNAADGAGDSIDDPIDAPDISLRVVRLADQFQLSANDVIVVSAPKAIDLVPDIIRVLDDAVIPRMRKLRAVHAGAVLLGERALLLPGGTHAGKSSLVAELLQRGAIYFSDEYALIDSEGRVHPYPRPLLLRNGDPVQSPRLADEFNVATGEAPAPIGWILLLQYLPGCTWSVAAITQSEALLSLLRTTPHSLAESPDIVRIFESAVASATCYAGCRAEAPDSVDRILQLADNS